MNVNRSENGGSGRKPRFSEEERESLNKSLLLTERFKLPTGLEDFHVLNHYASPLARLDKNPVARDNNFGTLVPRHDSFASKRLAAPVALGVKVLW